MRSSRAFRLLEGTLVFLFFWQAVRLVYGLLLGMATHAISVGQADFTTINGHLMLLVALSVAWFAPRSRSSVPRTLLISASFVGLLRIPMALDEPLIRIVTGVGVIGFAGMYQATLIRANWRTWVLVVICGLLLDMSLRAADTYDPSIRSTLALVFGQDVLRMRWLFLQLIISMVAICFSWLARRSARNEPYEPAGLTVWGGIGLGAFFGLQFLVLGLPNVVARSSGMVINNVTLWLILFTALPLSPAVRLAIGRILGLFDDRLRGWVWLLLMLLAIVIGNRVTGPLAAVALIIAQLMAVLTLWWIPHTHESGELEQAGPSFSLGLLVMGILIYSFSLTFERINGLSRIYEQGLIVLLIGSALLGLVRLIWREDDPWLVKPSVPSGLALVVVIPIVMSAWMQSAAGAEIPRSSPESTVSVATYYLNSGFNANGEFELELAGRTIEASLADIVILQQVDAGRPVAFGVDEAEFLARRLKMYSAYQSGVGKLIGVAILSRWPIVETRTTVLPAATASTSGLRVVVRDSATGRTLTIIAAQVLPGNEQSRLNQVYALQSLAGESTPLMIGVDLDASPDDVTYKQLMSGGYLDPDVSLGVERGFTTPADNPTLRSDYVFLRGLIPLASRQVNSTASTHRLVVVEVGFPQ